MARRRHRRIVARRRRQPALRAGGREPGLHCLERGGVDAVTGRDRVDAQPFDQLRRAYLPLRQREPFEQHARDRVRLRRRQAGDPVRHARSAGARRAEHRIDQRPGRRKIGDRHQHIGRLQRRVGVEPREQAVMQHFELTRETVAHVHLDPVLGRRFAEFGLRLQVEDRVLHAREPGRRGIADEARRVA